MLTKRLTGATRFSRQALRRTTMLGALAAVTLIAGCSSSDDEMMAFPPYQYGYLNQIHLNVATVQVADHAAPGSVPGDESANAPIPPDQALTQMAQQRLVAAGQSGAAIFTIDDASIVHEPGGTLAGKMDTHLDIQSSTGQQVGEVEAHVTRSMKPDLSKGDADSRANLYEITRQMMQDMNVELEFQIRNKLKDWLVDAGGMPTAAAIQTEALGGSAVRPAAVSSDTGSGAVTTSAAPSSAPARATSAAKETAPASQTPSTQSSEPNAIFPGGLADDATEAASTPAKVRSPAAGYLKAPAKH
ncbi:hypothetical protein [Acetobacter sp.]|uniref:hypothetical protein n=1 Tax=Acetobacter sp. TaxID=440 RepID=UPI0025B8F10B|nr:hypothetical protein [Acetobacter sp.]MCH4092450.1 hypothetical protein [Acetobacter sp.]MCI1299584.1 hypothetical protein [Acetobacter sp.]MCI1315536.1 hypothetical protein [Acetobacter sp.]